MVPSAGGKVHRSRSISVPAGEADVSAGNLFGMEIKQKKKEDEAKNEFNHSGDGLLHPTSHSSTAWWPM